MDSEKNKLHIMIASDKRYLCHATVTVLSILNNTNEITNFYFLDEGIGSANKKYLEDIIIEHGGTINFIEINKADFKNYPLGGHFKPSIYYRILGPDLIPRNIDKIIYLDSDIVVNVDLLDLHRIDIKGNILAAVKDPSRMGSRLNKFGIYEENYFNSGVLLVDLVKWRNENITSRTIEFIENNSEALIYGDQDSLNAILVDAWYQLDPKWNVQTKHFELEKYNDACLNPYVIHFTTDIKPWHIYSKHPYKELYLKYRAETRWRNVPLINRELQRKLAEGSKLILFGTGSHAVRIADNLPFKIEYFVDNNELKQGTLFQSKPVNNPDILLREQKASIAIVIASAYVNEISKQLDKMGFSKDVHYFELHTLLEQEDYQC